MFLWKHPHFRSKKEEKVRKSGQRRQRAINQRNRRRWDNGSKGKIVSRKEKGQECQIKCQVRQTLRKIQGVLQKGTHTQGNSEGRDGLVLW